MSVPANNGNWSICRPTFCVVGQFRYLCQLYAVWRLAISRKDLYNFDGQLLFFFLIRVIKMFNFICTVMLLCWRMH